MSVPRFADVQIGRFASNSVAADSGVQRGGVRGGSVWFAERLPGSYYFLTHTEFRFTPAVRCKVGEAICCEQTRL